MSCRIAAARVRGCVLSTRAFVCVKPVSSVRGLSGTVVSYAKRRETLAAKLTAHSRHSSFPCGDATTLDCKFSFILGTVWGGFGLSVPPFLLSTYFFEVL